MSSVPWLSLLPLVIAAVALYLLLPKPKHRPVIAGALLGLLAVVLAGVFVLAPGRGPAAERILFYCFSGLAILGAATLLTQRNPARAAISFALVVMNVCGLFLLQGAPFLMAAALVIYAGAIIVTFLFVLMLAQSKGFSEADDRTREPFLATLAGFVLLGTILLVLNQSYPDLRKFDELVARAETAASKPTADEIVAVLGNKKAFVDDLQEQEGKLKSIKAAQSLYSTIIDVEASLNAERPEFKELKDALIDLVNVGRNVRTEASVKALPAANVAGLGRLLYSRHLLAVELGGTLLLIATIGAIAITQRRDRRAA